MLYLASTILVVKALVVSMIDFSGNGTSGFMVI